MAVKMELSEHEFLDVWSKYHKNNPYRKDDYSEEGLRKMYNHLANLEEDYDLSFQDMNDRFYEFETWEAVDIEEYEIISVWKGGILIEDLNA